MFGYTESKMFLMDREKGLCQFCGKSVIGEKINIHHIISRAQGGTNRPDNLALLHEECHKKIHQEGLLKKLKKAKQYKEPTFMSIINRKFKEDYPDCVITYGSVTADKRHKYGMEKSHGTDAFLVSGGDNTFSRNNYSFGMVQKRRNDRSLQKKQR